jgi:integrase
LSQRLPVKNTIVTIGVLAPAYAAELAQRTEGKAVPTKESLQRFVRARLKAGVRPITVSGNLRQLRVLLRWAVRRGQVHLDVAALFDGVFPKAERPLPKAVHWSQVSKLLEHAEATAPRIAPLLKLCAYTGLRVAEAWHLQVRDIDIAECLLHVRGKPEVGWTENAHGAKRCRSTPLRSGSLST